MLKKGMSKLTIHEIAQLAGVSIGTVSRALNNRPGVSETTRNAILELVGKTGYIPDAGARRLAQGKKQLIGVAPFSENTVRSPYYSYMLDSIQERVYLKGYVARVLEPNLDDPALSDCAGFIVPGIHLDDSRIRMLQRHHVPLAIEGRVDGDVAWVALDNIDGMGLAVDHLLRLGHRQIVHLTGSPTGQTALDRVEGYRQSLQAAKIEINPNWLLDGNFTDLGAYRAVRQALESQLEFSAIAAASDEMAMGAILALQDAGLRVPHDISVTGFDDLPFVQYANPPITTVRQPIREIGHTVAELLLEQLEGRPPRQVLLPTHLIVRGSSGPKKHKGE